MGLALYRVRQFWWALGARTTAEEKRLLDSRLSPLESGLFYALALADQRHSLDVYHQLERWGYQDDDLLQAALLHDVGKGLVRIRLWHRVAIVLGNAVGRGLVSRWESKSAKSAGYAFYVHRHHSELGAKLLEQAGTRRPVVELTEWHGHGDDRGGELARALRQADDLC